MAGYSKRIAVAACLGLFGAPTAQAAPVLLATGVLGGTADLSGLTGTLENGVAANFLGGIGSGLAYAGGGTFLAVPDRGPNATSYNAAVDDTTSFIARFDTITLGLAANKGSGLPFVLTPQLQSTTLLSSPTPLYYGSGNGLGTQANGAPLGSGAPAQNKAGTYYFTGRSDNFDPSVANSTNPANARLDPESIRVSTDGKSVFVSDEYGPYVNQFDRAIGQRIRSFALPGNLAVANQSPQGAVEIAGNAVGRVANKGMEGLAITPDGKTLVGIMQAALEQDAPVNKNLLRIVTIDIATGQTHEYAYLLHDGTGVSDIVAINDHQFLVDERDGKGLGDGSKAKVKKGYVIDLANATDITNLDAVAAAALAVPSKQALDLVDLLTNQGGVAAAQIPSKIEGFAFGDDVTYNNATLHTLYVANDNDFVPDDSGPNRYYVVGLTDADLGAAFKPQEFAVPEPATVGLLGIGMAGLLAFGRRRVRVDAPGGGP